MKKEDRIKRTAQHNKSNHVFANIKVLCCKPPSFTHSAYSSNVKQ